MTVHSVATITKRLLPILLVAAMATVIVPAASADAYQLVLSPSNCGVGTGNCDSYSFTTTITLTSTPNEFNVTFKVQDTGKTDSNNNTVYDNSILTNFGLTLFTGSAAASSLVMVPAQPNVTAQLVDNDKTNNGNNMCDPQQTLTGSVCLEFTSGTGIPLIGPNAEQSFQFHVTIGGSSPYILTGENAWHIMASGSPVTCDVNGQNCVKSSNSNVFALTNNGTPQFQTPEPGSLTLFGAGLLGIAGIIRRKK